MKEYECSPLFGREWHPGCIKVKDFWLREGSAVAQWVKAHHGEAERLAKTCETADAFKRTVAHATRHICINCFRLIGPSDVNAGFRTCAKCRVKLREKNARWYARKKEAERLAKIREQARKGK